MACFFSISFSTSGRAVSASAGFNPDGSLQPPGSSPEPRSLLLFGLLTGLPRFTTDSEPSVGVSAFGGGGGDFTLRSTDLDCGLFDVERGLVERTIGCSSPCNADFDGLRFKIHFDWLLFPFVFDGEMVRSRGGDFGGTFGGISSGLTTGLGNNGTAVNGVTFPMGERIGDSGRVVLNLAGGTSSGMADGRGFAKTSTLGSVTPRIIASPKALSLQLGALLDRS